MCTCEPAAEDVDAMEEGQKDGYDTRQEAARGENSRIP